MTDALDRLFDFVFGLHRIHARQLFDRAIGEVAHHRSALICIEHRAHVGAHAGERARGGGEGRRARGRLG